MNDAQYSRFRKMNNENISILYTKIINNNIYFLLKSASNTNYKISIKSCTHLKIPKCGKIFCSCPDNKFNSNDKECVCKHILYILFKYLKIFSNLEHTFFKRRYFTPDEMSAITKILNNKQK